MKPANGAVRARVHDAVVQDLGARILKGEFAPGDRLPNETELTASLRVSRTSVREAIKFLSAKGLVEARPRLGMIVREREAWNLLDPEIMQWQQLHGHDPQLVRSLLELGREISLRVEPVRVEQWANDVLTTCAHSAATKEIRLECRVSVDTWPFDSAHLGRATAGLLANAIEFSPRGGTVSLLLSSQGEQLFVCVADEGPGVPAELAERIFEPFFTTRAGGNGLGLALVREVAEAHGGTVELQRQASGTRFEMRIPWLASS